MNKTYWIYNKYSIISALINPKRKILEFVVEEKKKIFYEKLLMNTEKTSGKKIDIKIKNKKYIVQKIGSLAKYQGAALLVEKLQKKTFSSVVCSKIEKNIILILDKINDPNNLGAIMRTCMAFGVQDIIVTKYEGSEENSYISSIASGALDRVNIYVSNNLNNTIKLLKNNDWWVIGLESKNLPECTDIKNNNFNFKKKAIVLGSESDGIRKLVRENCDVLTRINIKESSADSINVVQATTIALYELCN